MNAYKLNYILLGGLDSTKSQLRKLVKESNIQENEKTDSYVQKLLSEVFTGMQGRYTRLKIILALAEDPMNTLQLSKKLGYDYKSVQHNLKILEKNHLIEKVGKEYGRMFFISELLSSNLPTLLKIIEKVDKKLNRKKTYIS
jgi:DNA-binding transcriptional ArsR family regulator